MATTHATVDELEQRVLALIPAERPPTVSQIAAQIRGADEATVDSVNKALDAQIAETSSVGAALHAALVAARTPPVDRARLARIVPLARAVVRFREYLERMHETVSNVREAHAKVARGVTPTDVEPAAGAIPPPPPPPTPPTPTMKRKTKTELERQIRKNIESLERADAPPPPAPPPPSPSPSAEPITPPPTPAPEVRRRAPTLPGVAPRRVATPPRPAPELAPVEAVVAPVPIAPPPPPPTPAAAPLPTPTQPTPPPPPAPAPVAPPVPAVATPITPFPRERAWPTVQAGPVARPTPAPTPPPAPLPPPATPTTVAGVLRQLSSAAPAASDEQLLCARHELDTEAARAAARNGALLPRVVELLTWIVGTPPLSARWAQTDGAGGCRLAAHAFDAELVPATAARYVRVHVSPTYSVRYATPLTVRRLLVGLNRARRHFVDELYGGAALLPGRAQRLDTPPPPPPSVGDKWDADTLHYALAFANFEPSERRAARLRDVAPPPSAQDAASASAIAVRLDAPRLLRLAHRQPDVYAHVRRIALTNVA